MTTPAETIETDKPIRRSQGKFGLYVTDAELVELLGVPKDLVLPSIRQLEDKKNFPKKDPLFGDRRYWPAVRAWLDRHNRLNPQAGGL